MKKRLSLAEKELDSISRDTVAEWTRELAEAALLFNAWAVWGAESEDLWEALEWDETFFAKRTHQRGRRVRKAGVRTAVGGARVITLNGRKRVIDFVVAHVRSKRRDENVPLLDLIAGVGATVSTDCAAMYANFSATGRVHHAINHKKEFVDADGHHTNSIEGMWSVLKKLLKMWKDHAPTEDVSFSLMLQLGAFVARTHLQGISIHVALVNLLRWRLRMTNSDRSVRIWNILVHTALTVFGTATPEQVEKKESLPESDDELDGEFDLIPDSAEKRTRAEEPGNASPVLFGSTVDSTSLPFSPA